MKLTTIGFSILGLLLTSCATSGFYYGVDAKTPTTQSAHLILGVGVTLEGADGSPLGYGPGPIDIVVRPGLLKAGLSSDYYFDRGNLERARPKRDHLTTDGRINLDEIAVDLVSIVTTKDIVFESETIELTPQAGETWFVGREFSRSILEMPSQSEQLGFDSSAAWDPSKPQTKLVAFKVNPAQSQVAKTQFTLKAYTGSMPPFFTASSRFLVYSKGRDVEAIDFDKENGTKIYRVAQRDLVWGSPADDDTWWFLDTQGTHYLFSVSQAKVIKTEVPAVNRGKPMKVVGTSLGLVVQTEKELTLYAPKSFAPTSVWNVVDPILDWTASTSGAVALLTTTELVLLDTSGQVVAKRAYQKGEIPLMEWASVRGLALSPDGKKLAFLDQLSRVWTLETSQWTDFPRDWWKTIGHSYVLPARAQSLVWGSAPHSLFAFDANFFPNSVSVLQFELPDSQATGLYRGSLGEAVTYKANLSLFLAKETAGVLSEDGKKIAFMVSGATPGVFGVAVFHPAQESVK